MSDVSGDSFSKTETTQSVGLKKSKEKNKTATQFVLEDFGTVPSAASKMYHASKTRFVGSDDQEPQAKAGWKSITDLPAAITKARDFALERQNDDGHWVAEAESNCSIQAEYVMLRKILDFKNPEADRKLKRYLLRQQNEDGGWSLFSGGPSCPSVTAEVYFALKLLGEGADAKSMLRARQFVLGNGGLSQTRIFTRMNFAMFGMYDWSQLPALPPEIMLLPESSPFTIYDMSSWARGTVVPLLILFHEKVIYPLETEFRCDELYLDRRDEPGPERAVSDPWSIEKLFIGIDKLLWAFEKLPVKPLREKALQAAEQWILQHQETSGDWAGIFPPMINSILALRCRGYADDHPVIKRGLDAMHHFIIEREDHMRIQCTNSPLWDTALIHTALLDAGLDPLSEASRRAADYYAKKQLKGDYGDWKIKNKKGKPGGWSFEYFNSWYPDTDDTAAILLAMHRIRSVDGGESVVSQDVFYDGLNWLLSMQSEDGGFGAFDLNNNMHLLNRIPFADLKSMLDFPTEDIAGRVLELIGLMNARDLYEPHVRKAVAYLKSKQCRDGSWWGRWGVNYIYGTCHALQGLAAVGEKASDPAILKALMWVKSVQNPDGGWGESCLSYNTDYLKGRGVSTASQTAWGMMSLLAFLSRPELPKHTRKHLMDSVEAGALWLLKNQQEDGTWFEPEFTGTGFPCHFYLRYHAYRHCFPLTALGRFQQVIAS